MGAAQALAAPHLPRLAPPPRVRYNKRIETGKGVEGLPEELVKYEDTKGLDHLDLAGVIAKCGEPGVWGMGHGQGPWLPAGTRQAAPLPA